MTRLRLTAVLSFFTLVVGGQAMAWSGAEHVIKVTRGYNDRVKDNLWQERLQQQERQPATRGQVPRQGTPALADDWSDCAGSDADVAIGACTRLIQADGGYVDLSTLPRVLVRRDSSPEIEALQRFLAGQGYDVGTIDGVYGPATQQAILKATREQRVSVRDLMFRGLRQKNLVVAYNNRGNAYYEKGDYDRAIIDYDQAIRLDPAYVYAYGNRGYAYGQKGDHDRAIADFDQVIRLNPNDARGYFNRGHAYVSRCRVDPRRCRKGDYDRAIADYDQAIRFDPGYAPAYNNRGNAYSDKGEYDRAIADYDQALRIDPSYAPAYTGRGIAYAGKGRFALAIADYDEAIRYDPNGAPSYFNRGLAYDAKGDHAKALIDFRVAASLYPSGDPWKDRALTRIAQIEIKLAAKPVVTTSDWTECASSDPDIAIGACTRLIRLDPNNSIAYAGRGLAYGKKGAYDRAIADLNQAIRLDPGYAFAYATRGNAYANKGAYDQAIADLDQAIRLDPGYAPAYYNRGNAYDETGDHAKALIDFRVAASLYPSGDPWKDRALTRIAQIEMKLAAKPVVTTAPSPAPTLPGSPNVFTGGNGGIVVEVSQGQIDGQMIAFVSLSGEMKLGDEKYFNQALQTVGAPVVIVSLQGPGGAVPTGIAIGRIIWNNQYRTLVGNDFCVSMCAYAWLAGRRRYKSPDAQIGFHAPWKGDETKAEVSSVGSAILGQYLEVVGITTDAVAYMTYPGPNDEMQFLTAKDARELGIYFEEWRE